MNSQSFRNRRGKAVSFLMTPVMLLLLLLTAEQVSAYDFMWDSDKYVFRGQGTSVSIELPVYDKDGRDMWAIDGYVYVKASGKQEKTLLHYKSEKNISGGATINAAKFETSCGGIMKIKDTSDSWVRLTEELQTVNIYSANDNFTAKLEWEPPYEWRGMDLEFVVRVHGDQNSWKEWNREWTKKVSALLAPPKEVKPGITTSMLTSESGHTKQVSVIWQIAASSVTSATAYYKANGTQKSMKLANETFGTIYLPSDQLINDLYVRVDYIDSEGHQATGQESEHYDVPYFHQAKSMRTKMMKDGSVELEWSVDNKDRTDIMPTDFWIIQRNADGKYDDDDEGWTSIGQVSFRQGEEKYSFVDNTLMNAYNDTTVFYRVQRASVSGSWGYGSLSGTAKAVLSQHLALPQVLSATVKQTDWGVNDKHSVRINWNTDRSDLDFDGNTFYLRNKHDWESFCLLIGRGFVTMNGVMLNDIDISGSELMAGEEDFRYQGTFDGKGHKLTINYKPTEQYAAPFRYCGDGAFIKNLHVDGTITTGVQFAAGIMARSSETGTTRINNCRSTVTISSTIDGDGTHGGLVAIGGDGTLMVTNCLFDGELQGFRTERCGGIVGYMGANAYARFENVMFAPRQVTMSTTGSSTFIRTAQETNASFGKNCLYSESFGTRQGTYYPGTAQQLQKKMGPLWVVQDDTCQPLRGAFHIRNFDDWLAFKGNVNQMKVDVVLDTDLEVLTGINGCYEDGTFDGQGHTINIRSDSEFCGLFKAIKNATIKNLNVTGYVRTYSVNNEWFAGSIVCRVTGTSPSYLYNCYSTAEIRTYRDDFRAGGLVGCVEKDAKAILVNCRYDGLLDTRNTNELGGLVGWVDDYGKASVINCLFAPSTAMTGASGSMTIMRYNDELTTGIIDNCYYTKAYGKEQGTDASLMSDSELAKALGSGWKVEGGRVVPIVIPEQTVTYVWDPNAQMRLFTDKYVGGELRYTDERVITAAEREAGQIDMELLSPCVDYSFRISVERGQSMLRIGDKGKEVTADTYVLPVEYNKTTGKSAFYFDNNVKMDSLKTTKLHTAVQLNWWTNGGNADYFEVYRRDITARTDFGMIAGDVEEHSYTDQTAKAHHVYEYMVKAVVQCEGVHTDTLKCTGKCNDFGRISGFVRTANGTGIGGISVKAMPDEALSGIGTERTVTTDATGYFIIDSLAYIPNNGRYSIMVDDKNAAAYTMATCNFTEDKNEFVNTVLALREYYVFTGKVLYEGSSIPVPGARFLLDGKPLYDYRQNRLETDNEGAFSINVPKGPHSIKVEKEGHVFENDGYYIDPDNEEDPTVHDWQRNKADVYFWDQTRITLRGRMAGGDIQGQKPLGQSLSYNNLGHDLKIIMMLEGDNTSWIVRDPLDLTIKERSDSLRHGAIDPKTRQPKDITRWDMTRHSITIHPDETTGEYEVKIFPVKYKVTEMSCTGYPTLFQQGKVGETLDLTNVGMDSIAEFKCIYHTPVKLAVNQVNITGENYFGERFYLAQDIDNHADTVNIWIDKTDTTAERYVLGHPVFMSNASYLFNLQAQEEYAFENRTDTVTDIVPLHEGTVYFHNDLVGKNVTDSVRLDSIGRGIYRFVPQNTTFLGSDQNALRTLDINLLYDGVFYDVKPFNGEALHCYVMGAKENQGKQTVAKGATHLVDILRDPPGSGSSAYIESGSKLKYSYTAVLDGKLGVSIEKTTGTGSNYYIGTWAGVGSGPANGTISSSSSTSNWTFSFNIQGGGTWVYSYEMNTTQRIQTSSSNKWIGSKADIFIGFTDNIILSDGIAVRMVPESQYKKLINRTLTSAHLANYNLKGLTGTVNVLAEGFAADSTKVYLISDEVMTYSAKFNSEFIHTADYIETELIPYYIKLRNERLLPMGTSTAEAQAMANRDRRNVYISTVAASHSEFGYDASMTADKKNRYTTIHPKDISDNSDDIADYNKQMLTWAEFLARNEREKIQASYAADLVKNYDFDGAANVQYSESFTTSDDYTAYFRLFPLSFAKGFSPEGAGEIVKTTFDTFTGEDAKGRPTGEIQINSGFGAKVVFKVKPVLNIDFNDKNGKTEAWSKKTGFTLSAAARSNYNISVYRTKVDKKKLDEAVKKQDADVFLQYSNNTLNHLRGGFTGAGKGLNWTTYVSNDEQLYGNFIFKTNGGATCQPWEDERKSQYFQPGTVYDEKTIRIDQLRIWAEQSIVSNVPYGEAARFTIHMINESPLPAQATQLFNINAPENTNRYGAKILIGGTPLNGSGYQVLMRPGEVVTKEVEVFAGSVFDYDDLSINIIEPNDPKRPATLKLSAHFVPSAGHISISTPGDKWVVNTESPYDPTERSYYMPVRIDGFDVNQRNFDHIELQYKLSTQGDKDWVNICSYYKSDSLMALANGNCELIKNDGYIVASFFGEKDPIEQYYDLRAVVYCRNGNGFLTASSPILTGVKDTRRPTAFGTPKPVNGILGIGDDITIAFSEPVAGNYLSEVNNFEVLGMTNSNNVTQGTCLRFNGNGAATTIAERNFASRSFTLDVMVKPDKHSLPMGIFRHGTMRNNLQAGLSADNRLMVVINNNIFYSDKPIDFNGLQQICYAFQTDMEKKQTTINFYEGTKKIGTATYNGIYSGSGILRIGSNFVIENEDGQMETESYRGKMLEMRVWNKAVNEEDIYQYGQKHLTGYELGLLDNFRMNEGNGSVSYNKAVGGTDLQLNSATWSLPEGLSIKLDGTKGVTLKDSAFVRTASQDYTLMFWFRTNNDSGTLLANGPARNEPQWKNHFNIGLDNGKIFFRSGNMTVSSNDKSYNDDAWHHLAVTVNRSRNVGNLYIDQQLLQTFAVDTLGGIIGGTLAAGVTYQDAYTTTDALSGNMDELALYEMTLPVNVIKDYATSMPTGREMGTLVYLPFSRMEKQKNNEQRMVASGESIKQSRDNQGNYSTRKDVIITDEETERVSDRENYAPIDNTGKRENLNYSFVTDNQNLLINIDEPAVNIEKTNLYITVRDVADLNGNIMENPIMMDLYVYRNPLRWKEKRLNIQANYGEEVKVDVTIQNLSGKKRTYYLEDLPLWITPSKTSGTLDATDEETITLTVSPFTNIGNFDEKLNLLNEEGMNEPLPIHIKVRGEKPDWKVSEALKKKNLTMSIVARVKIDGIIADDTDDVIGVFGNRHETLGTAHLNVDNAANAHEALTFITVYNNNTDSLPLRFEFYDHSTGRISVLIPEDGQDILFRNDTIIGTTTNPVTLVNSYEEVQIVHLEQGWNWLSFYVKPEKNTINNLLNSATQYEPGDALEVLGRNGFYDISYKAIPDEKNPTRINYFWDRGKDTIDIDVTKMYRFYSKSRKDAYISGYYDQLQVFWIEPGWNRIAYLSHINLPIATALADYTTNASIGDIIKSQNEFAVLVEDAQHNLIWKGTLTHLKTGEGYMLKHVGNNELKFYYPYYDSETRYGGVKQKAPLFRNTTGRSMNVIARAADICLQTGDRLVAFNDAEVCGVSEMTADSLFFLSIADSGDARLSFAIERDGELIAVTGEQFRYATNAVMGTVSEPTVIRFATTGRYADGQWYDMQGRKLTKRPERKGVYIFNGQKTIVE